MINLNLLPWREEARTREKKRFFMMMTIVALMAGAFIFRCHWRMEKRIAHQHEINHALQDQIALLDNAFAKKQTSEKRKAQLKMQYDLIQALQTKQLQGLYWFELFADAPAELYFTHIVQTGSHLLMEGKTLSPKAVSAFMHNRVEAHQLNWSQADPLMGFSITVNHAA